MNKWIGGFARQKTLKKAVVTDARDTEADYANVSLNSMYLMLM